MRSASEMELCVISITGEISLCVGLREKSSNSKEGMLFLRSLEAKMYVKQMSAN